MKSIRNQRGTTVVEFAAVGVVLFLVLFALIDFSRLYFDMAALDESTRRGARVAAVCPVNDPIIQQVALFNGLVPTLGAEHIAVQYLDAAGNVIAAPGGSGYGSIRFVRVAIQNFQLQTLIPGLAGVLTVPAFTTTIPSESLGRVGTADISC
ncbi:MAG: pilus assembly protein [Gammaproteobacteria bacterium]|nr:pilus assembly protein [Gammaproteobacteria bacterium]NNC57671.1 pilus assembly protein [Woeseiaceae bacterium]NNL49614.1 pilus assembly protein [Woeseiaceae bacterium]